MSRNNEENIFLDPFEDPENKPQRSLHEAMVVACVLAFAVIAVGALGFVWVSTQNKTQNNWQAAAPSQTQTTQSQTTQIQTTQPQTTQTQPVQTQPALNYIPWDYSYENAMQIARNQNKPVLMNFYTDWCGVCKQMDSGTFTDPSVIAEAQNYVTIKINAEQRTDLAQQYNVNAYPTFIIADGSGNVKYNDAGGFPATQFVRLLQSYR